MAHFSTAVLSENPEIIDELLFPYTPDGECEDEEYNIDYLLDEYCIGGRFSNLLPLKPGYKGFHVEPDTQLANRETDNVCCDQAQFKDLELDKVTRLGPWAIVTPDGEWIANDDPDTASQRFRSIVLRELSKNPDLWLTIIDCHS